MIHYANLSRGVLCPDLPADHSIMRVESTACEQKDWSKVAWQVAASGLLCHLARGEDVVIHDYSERPRITRALWQGIPLVTYWASLTWGLSPDRCVLHPRGGGVPQDVTRYANAAFRLLDPKVERQLRYYGKFLTGAPGLVIACRARLHTTQEIAA